MPDVTEYCFTCRAVHRLVPVRVCVATQWRCEECDRVVEVDWDEDDDEDEDDGS